MKTKKIIYIDMDGVLCDLEKSHKLYLERDPSQPYPQSNFEFWHELDPIPHSIESFFKLEQEYNLYILSKPSIYNLMSYTGKAAWIKKNLGFQYLQKLILSCDKTLLIGDYLIDDSPELHKDFKGEIIPFGNDQFSTWIHITKYLLEGENA